MMNRLIKFFRKRAVILMLLLPLIGSLIILSSFYIFIHQTKDDVLFTDVAGRQRMLSEQIGHYAHMVFDMRQDEARESLNEAVATFNQSLTVMDRGGEIMGRRLSSAPPKIQDEIDAVKQLWMDLKPALLLVADQSTITPQTENAKAFILGNIPRLRDLSNEVVSSFEFLSLNRKEMILRILISILSFNFILLFTGILVMKSYLAERKRAQEVIQKSEERLREAQKVAQMGCWELDLTTNALIWSDEVYRIFNINPQEFTGTYKAFLDRIHPNDREFVNKAFAESVNNHTSYDIVHRFLLKDGTLKYVNERCKTFYDETGKPIRSVGTVQDITERVQSRKKIEEALEKAKQGERVKTLFMANMSHEVRTPLNGILGFLELIEAQTRHLLDEEQQGFFDLIRNNGNRLMRTVSEILDISQIEAGTYKGRMHDINLVPLVSMVVREYRMHARQKNLKLEYISDLETAIIYADEYGVFQAISNLLDNAIKYTEKGCVTLSLMKKAKHFILTIQDTGIGMSQEYLDRMFEVFSQESEGYTKKYQGIGLGMAIGKRHLDMNNVDLTVESTKGAGTVFTLTFQEAEDTFIEKDVSKADIEVTPEVESGEKPLVLLVEDDLSSQQLVKAFLKSNYDVCVSTSVKDAKQRLKEYQVNIVLLDLSLEGKEDGLDLVKWMRRTKTWKKTPVIATTAHAFTTDQINCIKAGCNEYLAKPIRRSRLLEKIRIFA